MGSEPLGYGHALIIGGTGMLAGATRRLAERSHHITLVARSDGPMPALVGDTPATFVAVDYTDVDAFRAGLRTAREVVGSFDLVVAWLHTVGDPALEALSDLLEPPLRFVHVLGSRGRDAPRPTIAAETQVFYQRVLLGHVVEGGERRWLSHDEISDGVWRAIGSTEAERIIGHLSD